MRGPPGIGKWRGAWSALTDYDRLDLVSHNGRAYLAGAELAAGVEPPAAPWELVADRGDKGVKGDQGEVGMTWRGEWDSALGYTERDAVFHEGYAYIAALDVMAGVEPTPDPLTEPWDLLASKGGQGPQGESVVNIDGGTATTNFVALDTIDGGNA